MQTIIKSLFLVLFAITCHAQVTILDQSFLTSASFGTFTAYSVTGNQTWYQSDLYGAVCNGYSAGQSYENEDWLISPPMDLTQTDNVKLTFNHTRGNAGVMNSGVAEGWYKVFATANYSGNPASTLWVELSGLNQTVPAAWQFIGSGNLIIPEAAKSANSRIAFRYISSATQSATWEIKNVKVTGESQNTNLVAGVFKITNWNVEWLGCTLFGPSDEAQQLNNVASAMLAMNSDLYCLQEVTNAVSNQTLVSLVALMGTEDWAGSIATSNDGNCDQRQAVIYKKSRVQLVSSALLGSGNAAQGNTYYFNWASGRYPALFNLNFIAGANTVPISLVNIHAKAEDGNSMSYTRRLGASEALKSILDGAAFNTKNVILTGDFNDYLIGTSSAACACTDSPYRNFVDDTQDYKGITQSLENVWSPGNAIIEHTVISNELFANYVTGSAFQEVATASAIPSFYATTSHHLPVSTMFQFPVLSNPEFAESHGPQLTIYPNPVKNELAFIASGVANYTIRVFDLMGRQMNCRPVGSGKIDVSALPAGIYVLKAGNEHKRFLKE